MAHTVKYILVANRKPERLKELLDLLQDRFGSLFILRGFNDNNSAINSIDDNTSIIIFDNSIESENKELALMTIKSTFPKVNAIMRSSNVEIEMAVDDFCKKNSYHLFRKGKSWERMSPFLYSITNPIRLFIKEFFVRKFLIVFLIVFVIMGLGIFLIMNYTD